MNVPHGERASVKIRVFDIEPNGSKLDFATMRPY